MTDAAKIMSFHTATGTKGTPSLLRHLFVLLHVGGAANQAAWHRPLVDTQLQHHQQVYGDEGEQQPGNHEDMKCKESRQRIARDDGTAEQQDGLPKLQ